MVYARPFHRLVFIGTQMGDAINTSVSIAGIGTSTIAPVNPTLLSAVATICSDWWDDTGVNGPEIVSQAKLTSIKLNLIGTDGKYMTPYTNEHIYPTPVSGGGPTAFSPAQLASVVTFRTSAERGKASKGRMFLPACTGYTVVQSDGRATVAQAQRLATGTASLVIRLNQAYQNVANISTPGVVTVMSNIGSGTDRVVIRVSAGRVPDTMRSRRNKLAEDPQEAAITTL